MIAPLSAAVTALGTAVTAAVLVLAAASCASSAQTPAAVKRASAQEITLAPGESHRVPQPALTLTFEAVSEDSRCPTGVTCIWEGDAAVRIRLATPGAEAASYTLHTSDRFEQEAVHGGTRVRLVSVAPHPTADGPVKPEDYRVTFAIDPQ